jgi:hypothetical protein
MQSEGVVNLVWPDFGNTVSLIALALALVIFLFAAFSGGRANKARIILAVCLATVIGWFLMPLVFKVAAIVQIADKNTGVVIVMTAMMFLVSAMATGIYEIITVSLPDIGMASKK